MIAEIPSLALNDLSNLSIKRVTTIAFMVCSLTLAKTKMSAFTLPLLKITEGEERKLSITNKCKVFF